MDRSEQASGGTNGATSMRCEDDELAVGDVIKLSDARELVGAASCKVYQLKAEVDGVTFQDDASFPSLSGTPVAFASGHARVGDTCTGEYSVSLMGVPGPDLAGAPSDYMIARQLNRACSDGPAASGLCLDYWYVRVHDGSGKQLSKDNPGAQH